MNIPTNDKYYKLKKSLLESNILTAQQTYDFDGTLLGYTVSERLLAMGRVVLMQEDEIHARNNVRTMYTCICVVLTVCTWWGLQAFNQAMISPRNEIAVYDNLIIACRRKLQAFTTT